ncbi:MAG: heavy metal translocating P-type ATPase, partial [Eubacteriales bacterium]|nr:heavy metal translocating P-type ATPase [Eubacteriales bacterium]
MPSKLKNKKKHNHHDFDHHGHDNSQNHEFNKYESTRLFYRILIAFVAVIAGSQFEEMLVVRFIISVAGYIVIAYDVLVSAYNSIRKGRGLDETFLISLATIGAICIGEYTEGVMVMVLYQIGEVLQGLSVSRTRKSIAALMDIRPDYAWQIIDDEIIKVSPASVVEGDKILVKTGERIPIDGIIIDGATTVDNSALTGESIPVAVGLEDCVYSGGVNTGAAITIRTTASYSDSTVSRIIELAQNAGEKKAQIEAFIHKFAKIYTPCVVVLAALTAILAPTLFDMTIKESLYNALVLLVISCPCALVISIPVTFFAGVGLAAKKGIIIKGGNVMTALAKLKNVVFDKTGTLTEGSFSVISIVPENITSEELLELAAYAECMSTHPVSKAIVTAYGKKINPTVIDQTADLPGKGVYAIVGGKTIHAGNEGYIRGNGVEFESADVSGVVVYIAFDGNYCGYIVVSDKPKESTMNIAELLRLFGVEKVALVTGDTRKNAVTTAEALNITNVYFEATPEKKVAALEEIMAEGNGYTAFVGDGINDAPVLARADVGVAMG